MSRPTRLLLVSNLDSARPFGQFTRPFFLGQGLARQGWDVANVGVDCSRVDFGPSWSTGTQSLRRLMRAISIARGAFAPDLIYAHQNLPGVAAVAMAGGTPVVVDFHSIPSMEWAVLAAATSGTQARAHRVAALKARAAEYVAARRADGLIAAGAAVARDVEARYRPTRRVPVVVNGVDPDLLNAPLSAQSPYPSPNGTSHVMATLPGSASPANVLALEFLAASALELERSDARVRVHVVGSADGPGDRVVSYHGLQQSLLPWIEHAEACLMPYPAEAAAGGARNKLLEYLARGRRIVTTREGLRGLEHVEAWSGVVVAEDDPTAFAASIARATAGSEPTLEASRAEVAGLSWDALAVDVATVLEDVLSGTERRHPS